MDIDHRKKISDAESVRWDYILKKKGYKFIYILDADDIKNHCDPFGQLFEGNLEDPKSTEDISDLDHVFHDFVEQNANNIVLPRYYHKEIAQLRDLIGGSNRLERALLKETLGDLNSFMDKTGIEGKVTAKDALDFIIQKFSVFDTFFRNNSLSMIEKLTGLFKDKILFENQLKGKLDDTLMNLFEIANGYMQRPTSRHDIKFIRGLLGESTSYERDAYAIYLTLILNHLSGLKKLHYIFIFFSSTLTAETTFTVIKEKSNWKFLRMGDYLSSALDGEVPIIKNYSFLRSKEHLLLNSSFQSYIDFGLGNWDVPEDYLDKEFTSISYYYKESSENIGFINKRIDYLGVNDFKSELEKFKANVDNSNLKQIESITGKLINLLGDFEGDYKNSIFGAYLHSIFLRKTYFFEFKSQLISGQTQLMLDRGLDRTDSLFNVMPCLFMFQKGNPIAERGAEILESIFHQNGFYENDLNFPKESIRELLDLEVPVQNDSWASFVILPYVLMLIKFNDSNGRDSNMIVRKWLKEVIQLFENYQKFDDSFKDILPEIYVLLCWATRRTRHYREAYELNKKVLEYDWAKSDPRFYQSISLICHTWITEFDKDEYENPYPKEVNYEMVIDHTISAIELFDQLPVDNVAYSTDYLGLIKSVLTNNIGTFICSNIENLYDGKSTDYLKQQISTARKYLRDTKISREKDKTGDNWPVTYLHTEAYTEYWELVLGTRENEEKVKKGYEYALRDISNAIRRMEEDLSPSRRFLFKECQDVLFKLQKLNIEDIVKNLGNPA